MSHPGLTQGTLSPKGQGWHPWGEVSALGQRGHCPGVWDVLGNTCPCPENQSPPHQWAPQAADVDPSESPGELVGHTYQSSPAAGVLETFYTSCEKASTREAAVRPGVTARASTERRNKVTMLGHEILTVQHGHHSPCWATRFHSRYRKALAPRKAKPMENTQVVRQKRRTWLFLEGKRPSPCLAEPSSGHLE